MAAAREVGLDEREAELTIRSGVDGGERNPRGPKKQTPLTTEGGSEWPEPNLSLLPGRLDPPPDFPGEAVFGRTWSAWIEDAAAAASAPPDYVALTLLTVAGSLIGNARWVSPWDDWSEPPIIWGMIIGGPSAGKTPAMKTVIGPLRAVENRVRQAAEKAHAEWKREASFAELRCKEWERRAAEMAAHGGTPPPPPDAATKAPHIPRLTVSDVTIEKLGDILASQPRGCLLMRDELAGFFGSMGRYTAGGGGDRQFWIEAFNGGTFSVERLSRAAGRIESLSVGLLGGIQPDRLASVLMRDADDDGMLARFCPVLPLQAPIAIPTRVRDTAFAERAFERLYGLELTIAEDGMTKPEIVRLAEPAKKLMHEHRLWVRTVEREMSGLVKSYIGKTPGAVARISMVLALLEWAAGDAAKPPEVIDAEVFRRASRYVVDYLYPMVRRAYAEASTAPEERAARALARSLHARHTERTTKSEILALKLEGLRNSRAVAAAVALLTDASILLEQRVSTGGRDRLEYLVNPRIWA